VSTPTSRTLEALRKQGYEVAVVEKWIPQTRRRLDAFGFIDLIALGEGITIGVQATSASNVASRVTKILEEPRHKAWLAAGNKIQVWGWSKKGKAGCRKLWTPTIRDIGAEHE
jgi:hypothetical protein